MSSSQDISQDIAKNITQHNQNFQNNFQNKQETRQIFQNVLQPSHDVYSYLTTSQISQLQQQIKQFKALCKRHAEARYNKSVSENKLIQPPTQTYVTSILNQPSVSVSSSSHKTPAYLASNTSFKDSNNSNNNITSSSNNNSNNGSSIDTPWRIISGVFYVGPKQLPEGTLSVLNQVLPFILFIYL
jgi:hypothetical protein